MSTEPADSVVRMTRRYERIVRNAVRRLIDVQLVERKHLDELRLRADVARETYREAVGLNAADGEAVRTRVTGDALRAFRHHPATRPAKEPTHD